MGAINTFSSVLPALTGFVKTFNTLDNTFDIFRTITGDDDRLARRQLEDTQRLQMAQLAQSNAVQKEQMALQAAQDEEKRREALRRAVSRQRASFGSQGVSSQDGSSQAVLLGLFDESEDERSRREQLDNMRRRALDLDYAQQGGLNLLQATQLAQKQKLQRII